MINDDDENTFTYLKSTAVIMGFLRKAADVSFKEPRTYTVDPKSYHEPSEINHGKRGLWGLKGEKRNEKEKDGGVTG